MDLIFVTTAILMLVIQTTMTAHIANISDGIEVELDRRAADPPLTWTEHWSYPMQPSIHNHLLKRKSFDNNVVVYYDSAVSDRVTWPQTFLAQVWSYTKGKYGSFGADSRLYAIFHSGKYWYSTIANYFDADHEYRNVIDCSSPSNNAWTSGTGNDLELPTHEISHIVEGASRNVKGSPAFYIWGDSKWAEIFIYDVYLGIGRAADAQRTYNMFIKATHNFPRPNTFWFRDWFYPIYSKFGKTAALVNYFILLSQNFPKKSSWNGKFNFNEYSKEMTFGEFIHFWSGAAKKDLTAQAATAFGTKDKSGRDWLPQLQQARKDFPKVTYPK